MAIVKCGSCGKQKSSKAPVCPHCGFNPEAGLEQLEKIEAKKRRDRLHRQNMLQMFAVVILLVGGYMWWHGSGDPQSWQFQFGRFTLVAAILLYAYARGLSLWQKYFNKDK